MLSGWRGSRSVGEPARQRPCRRCAGRSFTFAHHDGEIDARSRMESSASCLRGEGVLQLFLARRVCTAALFEAGDHFLISAALSRRPCTSATLRWYCGWLGTEVGGRLLEPSLGADQRRLHRLHRGAGAHLGQRVGPSPPRPSTSARGGVAGEETRRRACSGFARRRCVGGAASSWVESSFSANALRGAIGASSRRGDALLPLVSGQLLLRL